MQEEKRLCACLQRELRTHRASCPVPSVPPPQTPTGLHAPPLHMPSHCNMTHVLLYVIVKRNSCVVPAQWERGRHFTHFVAVESYLFIDSSYCWKTALARGHVHVAFQSLRLCVRNCSLSKYIFSSCVGAYCAWGRYGAPHNSQTNWTLGVKHVVNGPPES